MTTTVLDLGGLAAPAVDTGCIPATCRIGLLGLGTVGSAFARLTRETQARASCGFVPVVSVALVRTATKARPAAICTGGVTDSHEAFFAEPVDVIVEALGGVEPAYALVRRALDRGIPVVTANKSLIAAYGDELSRLARERATTLRFEASCIAGVPFLGTFTRRPLAARASAVTAILNGTSNSILTAMAAGIGFDSALADAQRLGLAEPDPSMDISGADAAEKLAILVRLFGGIRVDPASIPLEPIGKVEASDIAAAALFGGAIRPIAHASWLGTAVRAFAGPAFVGGGHPLARVAGLTNGIEIATDSGTQCYIGPGAGPDVTAATLLDDVGEAITERRLRSSAADAVKDASGVARPDSAWFLRLPAGRDADIADLLGAYGVWCRRLARSGSRTFVLTCAASEARVGTALDAVQAAIGGPGSCAAFPAIAEDAAC